MSRSRSELPPVDKAIGDILGTVHCLTLLKDVDGYRRWLNDYHSVEMTTSHFLGYKLLLSTLLRILAHDIEDNISLRLSEDDIFTRARFRGITINKLPNTCDKTIFIKNLFNHSNKLFASNDWHSLKTAMAEFSKAALYPLERIREVSKVSSKYYIKDLETAINYASIFQAYIFLNDTSRGRPHGYTSAMLDEGITLFNLNNQIKLSLRKAFPGYQLGVQYLWSLLLDNRFNQSVVKDLHQATDWESFDRYFDYIREEVINPIEQSTGVQIGFNYLVLIHRSPKRFLRGLLDKRLAEENFSEKDNLQRAFLWYPIELINSADYSFSGVPALVPLIMGMIQIRRRREVKSKAKLIRLIHGEINAHRRGYSYAVLVELGGLISDASGWILFYDCCSDRGSTLGLYRDIESILNRYMQEGFIELNEIRIDKRQFINIMEGEIIHIPEP